MEKYYISIINNREQYGQDMYVVTEKDVDEGGSIDPTPELFGIDTKEEAESIKATLEKYAEEKGYSLSFRIENYDFDEEE